MCSLNVSSSSKMIPRSFSDLTILSLFSLQRLEKLLTAKLFHFDINLVTKAFFEGGTSESVASSQIICPMCFAMSQHLPGNQWMCVDVGAGSLSGVILSHSDHNCGDVLKHYGYDDRNCPGCHAGVSPSVLCTFHI